MTPRVSLVIPVYNEGERIVACLNQVVDAVTLPFEALLVHDDVDDTTVPFIEGFGDERIRPVLNQLGPGPALALRAGIAAAKAPTIVVMMSDGSDDVQSIDEMVRLVERGCVIVAASRYMHGGRQVGGPFLKQLLSRVAGKSLSLLARVGTHDATNSFKAYSREFVESVGIESDAGFAVGIEMVAKARRLRLPVAEIPTIWLDRSEGQSRFRVGQWIPHYFRWYRYAFGPPLRLDQLQRKR